MRVRSFALVVVWTLAVTASTALAAPSKGAREVTLVYREPSFMIDGVGGMCRDGCFITSAAAQERFLTMTVADAVSPNVPVAVYQDFDRNGTYDTRAMFCTVTNEPLPTKPWASILIEVKAFTEDPRCAGFGWEGELHISFHRTMATTP